VSIGLATCLINSGRHHSIKVDGIIERIRDLIDLWIDEDAIERGNDLNIVEFGGISIAAGEGNVYHWCTGPNNLGSICC